MRTFPDINDTHDPALRSWVESANRPNGDFPIQNLPFGVFRRRHQAEAWRCGIAIGDQILDVSALQEQFAAAAPAARACAASTLNDLMALDAQVISALRAEVQCLLREGAPERARIAQALVPQADAELSLPVRVAGFTDFFASVHHATNAGRLFRPTNPLLPNYKFVPVAYNGRANSVTLSRYVRRPWGQILPEGQATPVYAPSTRLDYEVELGLFVGRPAKVGQPVHVGSAGQHVFGAVLLNDWSARDVQSWEYQPLGPFLAKSFATSISPWVVTSEALAPFRTRAAARAPEDPAPLPHLRDDADQATGAFSIQIEARLSSALMRHRGIPPVLLSRSDAASLYWTPSQMIAHHTSNGCALDTGDLLGTGTISGPSDDALGSLLELTRGGKQSLDLPSAERRTYLEDGDEIVIAGWCEAPNRTRIAFGECRATVMPA